MNRDELSIENDLVLKGDCILIPQSQQADILEKIHAGHQGAEKCKLRAKTCVFWHGIGRYIEHLVEYCHTCQQFQGKQPTESLQPHEIPVR